MLNFLKQSRKFVNAKEPICIVLGNESCDLDSAVSAIALAFLYHQKVAKANSTTGAQCLGKRFLPVLNIPREDYPLKTEVKYFFGQHAITEDYLTFRDELEPEFLHQSHFILVDHHVSPFTARCLEVFDHRSYDKTAQLPANCTVHMEIVGSCSTLIAEQVFKELENIAPTAEEHGLLFQLLRATIILDTVNFLPSAGRATAKDEQICKCLEKALSCFTGLRVPDREELFESLCRARADISELTALQLLRKDLKVLTNMNGDTKVAIPGFPLLVKDYVSKPDAIGAVQEFARKSNIAVMLLMGMLVEGSTVTRDLALIDIKNADLWQTLNKKLLTCNDPPLRLEAYKDIEFMNGACYQMGNVKATRKHILPLLKDVLDQWSNAQQQEL